MVKIPAEPYVTVGTTIPRDVYEKFKEWCRKHGIRPGEVLRNYVYEITNTRPNLFRLVDRVQRLETEVLRHDVYIYEIAKKTGVKLEKIAEKWFRKKPLPEE